MQTILIFISVFVLFIIIYHYLHVEHTSLLRSHIRVPFYSSINTHGMCNKCNKQCAIYVCIECAVNNTQFMRSHT